MTKQVKAGVGAFLWRGVRDEVVAIIAVIREEWPVLGVVLALLVLAVASLKPLPPNTIRIGMGQPGSGLAAIAAAYRDELAVNGVEAELVASAGAVDNLKLVGEGKIDVGFTQSGLEAPKNIAYLGSVEYQPLWLFHRGAPPQTDDVAAFLIGKSVSIGIEGSGTRMAADQVLQHIAEASRSKIRLLPLDATRTINDLIEGRLDAAFFLSPFHSPNTQKMLADPAISVLDFKNAEGLSYLMGFADRITLPAGAIGFSPVRPAHDTHMLAATIPLVVRSDLHPALQNLLLLISTDLAQRTSTPFMRATALPALVDRKLPRSPVAERFYNNGGLFLIERLPYWAATLIDSIWVAVVAFVAVLYPLYRMAPSYRHLFLTSILARYYRRAREIEVNVRSAISLEALRKCEADVIDLLALVRAVWIPNGGAPPHAALLVLLMNIEADLKWRQSQYAA